MSTQRYSVTPHPVETLLTWVKSGEIAIPQIQRPFVWEPTKVRNLLDSLYQGYPVGYLIAWRNPTVKLKDGTPSAGKRILIDGQQRVTALMAALLGREVLTKDYETVRIRIAFHPLDEKFEVANPAIRKDVAWIDDVADVFSPDASLTELTDDYTDKNPAADKKRVSRVLEKLRKIVNNHVGVIELAEDLDIETVTEIFIRVNSAGAELSQADFAMSKIAANETYGGNMLRKAIDYFCHLAVAPEFLGRIEKGDKAFAASEFFPQMRWLKDVNDDIYDPTYTDMLRVAFTSEFGRGKLADLVALLSGRNFETKQYEDAIAEASFDRLKHGILHFINKTHFDRITMILRSAGFVTSDLIGGQNAVNFAYILYLRGRAENLPAADLERLVRRWYSMSILRGRYTGSPETAFDLDIRQVSARGLTAYTEAVIESEMPESFWTGMLPQLMDTSSSNSPYFLAYQAAQVKLGDKGFLSRDIAVLDLLMNRSDVHHVYPRNHLRKQGLPRGRYNQIANFVLAQSEINIAIGDKAPEVYFKELAEQCAGGKKKYGGITDANVMRSNLRTHCLPGSLIDGDIPAYDDFLEERRKLMALKIRQWFDAVMIADLKPYTKYKESGLSWIREVPADWSRSRIKNLARPGYNTFIDGDWIESPFIRETGIRLIQTGNIGVGLYREKGYRYIDEAAFHAFGCTEFQPGDVLICRLGDPVGRACLAPNLGVRMITSVDVCILKTRRDVIPSFVVYTMSAPPYLRWVGSLVRGSTRDRVSRSMLGGFTIPLPSPEDQAAIGRFLDWASGRLERAIRAKRKVIALLNEQKQAIIHRAVTRGLDPSVPLKPSGIPWLGDIPRHWMVVRAKYLYREADERSTAGREELLSVSHLTGVTPRSEKNITMFKAASYVGHKLCQPGDLVVNTMWAWMGALGVSRYGGIVSPAYTVYRPHRPGSIIGPYMDGLLRSTPYVSNIICRSTGMRESRLRLYPEEFLRLPIVQPPTEEQQRIVEAIQAETADLSSASSRLEREIDLLREYRDRLVADVVTGKLDVRDAAARLPDEGHDPEAVPEREEMAELEEAEV